MNEGSIENNWDYIYNWDFQASRVATIATVHPIDYAWFTDSILSILRIVRTAGIDAYERVLPGLMYELHSYLKDIEPATRDVWVSGRKRCVDFYDMISTFSCLSTFSSVQLTSQCTYIFLTDGKSGG